MPNTKSAKKRLKQNEKLRLQNRAARSVVRNRIKKLIQTIKSGNMEQADAEFKSVASALDRAACHNIWHSNTTSRQKSRLSALILKAKEAKKQ